MNNTNISFVLFSITGLEAKYDFNIISKLVFFLTFWCSTLEDLGIIENIELVTSASVLAN